MCSAPIGSSSLGAQHLATRVSKPSLADYAKANPPKKGGYPCWACGIKEADEINEARRNGHSINTILNWLRDIRGYKDATKGKLDGHFINARHHERRPAK